MIKNILFKALLNRPTKMHNVCVMLKCLTMGYNGLPACSSMAWDHAHAVCASSALLCTVIILLSLQEEADNWLILCETLPPLQMHWQAPTLWLIKNQTDLFSFSSGEQRGSEQEDISINVSLNLLSHWRVFGGLTFLISPRFCYKCKYLHMCVEVSTPSKAHITLHTLPLKSKCSASILTTVYCHSFYALASRTITTRGKQSEFYRKQRIQFPTNYSHWTTDYLLRLYYASQKSLHSLFLCSPSTQILQTHPSIICQTEARTWTFISLRTNKSQSVDTMALFSRLGPAIIYCVQLPKPTSFYYQ